MFRILIRRTNLINLIPKVLALNQFPFLPIQIQRNGADDAAYAETVLGNNENTEKLNNAIILASLILT